MESDCDTVATVSKHFNCSISTWMHKLSKQLLQESKDFEIEVQSLTMNQNRMLCVIVKCILCSTNVEKL